ncbi:MFS general substrate transporter [Myriangium duriaei CBS 260.36]|uniref:MFS general substrate transporter n=1 Tax=Myriangium duriaei CBS 260.36 TaxID=1168546 RepID=A0A9P4MHA3_9PEZI|nr:MFS general substrate transporter [Myriangium duriaei CBS 260.36]
MKRPHSEAQSPVDQFTGLSLTADAGENHIAHPPHSIFSDNDKRVILIMVSSIGLISSFSAGIYLPALNTLADDLNVSTSLINLTITTYMILQGIAPSFVGSFSDVHGRRPAYLICFVLYIAANIGLALQSRYAALLVLRCVQSAGSSATVALGSATVADVSTRAERGKWLAWAMIGIVVGPTLGPVIGGLLDKFLGWRAIFWFLTIFSGIMGLVMLLFLPETCRNVVGNGSVPVPKWHSPLIPVVGRRARSNQGDQKQTKIPEGPKKNRRFNPLASLQVIFDKECGCILVYGALQYAGYFVIFSTLSEELYDKYGYNSLQTGLCFIPLGIGSIASRFTATVLVDWNYRRVAKKEGIEIRKNRQEKNLEDFPIERARLQIGIPMVYAAAVFAIIYSWVMDFRTSIAGPVIGLFLLGLTSTGVFTLLGTLIVDTNLDSPATAVASVNLARCLTGAAFTAFGIPLIKAVGIGWTGTMVAFSWVVVSPLLWLVMIRGPQWRKEKTLKKKVHQEIKHNA